MDTLTARSNALRSWAKTRDRTARTAPACRGMDARFEREARALLGDGATDRQIAQSADALRRAHFTDLARKSAIARRRH